MKNLLILSHARTGSTLLTQCFPHNEKCYNAGEFFWQDPMHMFGQLKNIIDMGEPVPKSFWPFIDKVLNPEKQRIFLVNKEDEIFSTQMYYDLVDILDRNNYDWVFTKFLWVQYRKLSINIESMIQKADYIIIHIRRCILMAWISHQRALETNQWHITGDKKSRPHKITWKYQDFILFAEEYKIAYDTYMKMVSRNNKKNVITTYYEPLSQNLDILNRYLETMNIGNNTLQLTQPTNRKQNNFTNIEDNFVNPQEYIKDKQVIETYCFI